MCWAAEVDPLIPGSGSAGSTAGGGGGQRAQWGGPVLIEPLEDEQTELPQQQNHAGPPLRLCLSAQRRHAQRHRQREDILYSLQRNACRNL